MAQAPLTLVVPLFNEEERLAEHAAELADFVASFDPGSELVFVDDGSSDASVTVARQLISELSAPARVIERPHLGKGAAVHAGLNEAVTPIAAFCDVDLATPLSELRRIITAAVGSPVLAIGSRDVVSTRLVERESELREFLGKSFNLLLRTTLTPGIYDTQCGAKAASTAVWREVLPYCRERGFAWDAEVVAVSRRRGIAVWEVGIEWHHDARSRVRPMRDGMAMVRSVPRILRRTRAVPSMVQGPAARPIDLEPLLVSRPTSLV